MIYAVGDIHGQIGQLDRILSLIEADGGATARVVFLGDYVDRGLDSRAVIQTFVDGQAAGRDWVFLRGNHDRMFERFLEDGETRDARIKSGKLWLHRSLGGGATLDSYLDTTEALADLGGQPTADYGFDPMPEPLRQAFVREVQAAIPTAHKAFLRDLLWSHHEGGKFFVHAGVRPGVPFGMQDHEDLIWIREPFLDDQRNHGALIVHGHTALDAPQRYINRINLDSGAGYGRPLTAAVFDEDGVFTLDEKGRRPL